MPRWRAWPHSLQAHHTISNMSNNNNSRAQQPQDPKKPKNLSSSNATPLEKPRDYRVSGRETQRTSQSGVFQGTPDDDRHQINVHTARHDARTPPNQASSAHTTSEGNDQPLPIGAGVPRTGSPPPSPPQHPPSSPHALSPPRTPRRSPTPSERYRAHLAQEAREKQERAELRARQAEESREARARETPEEREKRKCKEQEYQKNRGRGSGTRRYEEGHPWDPTIR